MTRLALILSLLLAIAAGLAPFGAGAAAHDCCCATSCACPEATDEPGCYECGPAAPSDEAPSSPVAARVLAPQPPAPAAAPVVSSEPVAGPAPAPAPCASGRSLLARLSILRV